MALLTSSWTHQMTRMTRTSSSRSRVLSSPESAAPPPMQLEFKNVAAKELKDKVILYNWSGLGWCAGRIRRPSFDKNKLVKVDGERRPANFIIAYEDGEGPHCLTAGKYGKGPLREGERWVLLEPVEEVVLEA